MTSRSASLVPAVLWSAIVGVPTLRAEMAPVVLGGTSTMQDMLTAANTDDFRAAGGGLYIHHNGWVNTLNSATERKAVWNLFKPEGDATVELGFGNPPTAWVNTFKANYLNNGLTVDSISVNGLSGKDTSGTNTVAQAKAYIDAFKAPGVNVPSVHIVLSPNSDGAIATTYPFASSYWDVQREVAQYGGGWTSDAPPSYFFARNVEYRDWIIAQTKWTNANGLKSINIISPHTSKANLFADSVKYVRYFEDRDAIPKQWVVENYSSIGDPPAGYVNRIGSEDNSSELAYTAKWLIGHVQGRLQSLDLSSTRTVSGVTTVTGKNAFSANPTAANVTLQNTASGGARVWTLNLANLGTNATNDFYAANLSAKAVGDTSHWSYTFTLNGQDVTAAIMNGGFTLSGAAVLDAGETATLSLSVLRLAGAGADFSLNLFAKANPNATVVADAMSFTWGTVPEPASLAVVGLCGLALGRRRRSV